MHVCAWEKHEHYILILYSGKFFVDFVVGLTLHGENKIHELGMIVVLFYTVSQHRSGKILSFLEYYTYNIYIYIYIYV